MLRKSRGRKGYLNMLHNNLLTLYADIIELNILNQVLKCGSYILYRMARLRNDSVFMLNKLEK